MKHVHIGESLSAIEQDTFGNCTELTSVTWSNTSKLKYIFDDAFYNCGKLPHIDIPSGTIQIDEDAFRKCYELSSITIPRSVQYIGGTALYFMLSVVFHDRTMSEVE